VNKCYITLSKNVDLDWLWKNIVDWVPDLFFRWVPGGVFRWVAGGFSIMFTNTLTLNPLNVNLFSFRMDLSSPLRTRSWLWQLHTYTW
jgi:hypothetical protein